jgi:serine/threonine-protein kinase
MTRPAAHPAHPPCPSCGTIPAPPGGTANFCPRCGTDLRRRAPPGPAGADAWVDQIIADRYRLLSPLGEGGMGAVYKAEHIRMGKALALKILRGEFASDPGAVERFRAEAQIVSRLSHPHTIAVFDFGEIAPGEGFYLAMEYVPGKDLARILREEGRVSEVRAARIGQQVLGSLAEAHDAGVVHRDMKPGNVMLMQTRAAEDWAKVLDFGIAHLRDEAASTPGAGGAGAIIGTPNYLSPEQARGETPDARADLYSFGAVLYELAAGRPPFVAPDPIAVVAAHLHQAPQPLAQIVPGISARYAAVVHRALEKKPQDRFRSADEMRDALARLDEPSARRPARPPAEAFVTGELQIASRDDFREFERQLRVLRRSRVAAPLGAALLLAAAAVAAWRWDDVYALLARRAPGLAAALPAAFRPAGLYDGEEHEPNDSPAQANRLPLPPGPDGAPGGGVAVMRGAIGERISETSGDVDVYRIEVPAAGRRAVLVAEWGGERAGEGVDGVDVALTLNRERTGAGRASAPLVANVDGAGAGRAERLFAAVDAGTYWLAVRERHRPDAAPVEKPAVRYLVRVRLADPPPGLEVEPNDAPDAAEEHALRYPHWRAVAERNPLGEAVPVHAATSREDPDTWSIAPRGPDESPALLVAVPSEGLALSARLWAPDEEDLGQAPARERIRFEEAAEARAGAVLFARLPPASADAPVLASIRADRGAGLYDVVALGGGASSGAAVLALVGELARAGRVAPALELAAGFARDVPDSPARVDVLLAAGRIAAEAAARAGPTDAPRFERAAQLLGAEIFEVSRDAIRYRGAFEARARALASATP